MTEFALSWMLVGMLGNAYLILKGWNMRTWNYTLLQPLALGPIYLADAMCRWREAAQRRKRK